MNMAEIKVITNQPFKYARKLKRHNLHFIQEYLQIQ